MFDSNVVPLRNAVPPHQRNDPSAYRPQPARDGPDFWPTIDQGLQDMMTHCVLPEIPPELPIWEAAAGSGHLFDPLRRRRQVVIATDLFPDPARPDIVRHDFLHGAPAPETKGAIMMTNPPNSQLTEFIVRALTLIDAGWPEGMAFLTRLGADRTKGRAAAFNRACLEWQTAWRPYWKPRRKGDKQPRWTAQWTLWRRGHPGPRLTVCLTHAEIIAPQLL
jgi:hypothetical protein